MSSTTQIIFKVIPADFDDFWKGFIAALIYPEKIVNRKELRFPKHRKPYTYRICESEESGFNFETVPTNKADPKRKSVWNQYLRLKQDENTLAISLESSRMELPDEKWNIKKSESQSELDFLNAKIRKRNEALKWIKYQFTKHQSTSVTLIDNNNGKYIFRSPPFGHNRSFSELLVGVILKADLCHIQRIMKCDGLTSGRPFDQCSEIDISRYLEEKKHEDFTSVSSLVESFSGDPLYHNEIMAALRFVPNEKRQHIRNNINNFAIAVFSNNLESKLLAQLRQKSFIKLAKEKYPDLDESQVPIVIYGEGSLESYSISDQQEDLNLEGIDKSDYKHYIDAIQYIKDDGNTINLSESFSCEEFLKLVAAVDPDLDLKDCNSDKFIELSNGSTPLMIACQKGHVGDVKYLLDHGADLEIKDKSGCNALTIAASKGHADVVECLINNSENKDTFISEGLWQAAKIGNLEMVNTLLESEECKKNYITNYFKTFLSASLYNKEKIIEDLFNVERESAANKEKVLFQLLKIPLIIVDILMLAFNFGLAFCGLLLWLISVFASPGNEHEGFRAQNKAILEFSCRNLFVKLKYTPVLCVKLLLQILKTPFSIRRICSERNNKNNSLLTPFCQSNSDGDGENFGPRINSKSCNFSIQ